MRAEEWISKLSKISLENEREFFALRASIPLGVDETQKIISAYNAPSKGRMRHLCATGNARTKFLKSLIVSLSCAYDREEISFFILSPKFDYSELLALRGADITFPFLRNEEDCQTAFQTLQQLVRLRQFSEFHYPRLVIVLDGLETLSDKKDDLLECYKPFMDEFITADVDIFSAVDLLSSIFVSSPGAFVGVGNCLVTADGGERADVTYAQADCSLSTPLSFSPSLSRPTEESIAFLNGLYKE